MHGCDRSVPRHRGGKYVGNEVDRLPSDPTSWNCRCRRHRHRWGWRRWHSLLLLLPWCRFHFFRLVMCGRCLHFHCLRRLRGLRNDCAPCAVCDASVAAFSRSGRRLVRNALCDHRRQLTQSEFDVREVRLNTENIALKLLHSICDRGIHQHVLEDFDRGRGWWRRIHARPQCASLSRQTIV